MLKLRSFFDRATGSFSLLFPSLRNRPLPALLLIVSFLIPIAFSLYTREIWEDFFITYRFSENLARGHGLVYNLGEHVHGFTSAINTLLPALFAWITHSADFRLPLLLYQGCSLAALSFAFLALSKLADSDAPVTPGWSAYVYLLPILLALEIKITAFTMNGQEAGFMLGFLAGAFAFAYLGWNKHYAAGGICFAGLLLTRPDGIVYIGAVIVVTLIFATEPRRALLGSFVRSGFVTFALYAPWLLFTSWYYGSPIPHTLIAKNGTESYHNPTYNLLLPIVGIIQKAPERLCGALSPIYDFQRVVLGEWPAWIHDVAISFELIAVLYWIIPGRDRLGRMASFLAFLIAIYLSYASLRAYSTPWYYPPLSMISIFTLTRFFRFLPEWVFGAGRRSIPVSFTCLLGLFCFLSFLFLSSLRSLKLKQDVIDWGHRRVLGEWLRSHVPDNESVYLEPLGYIGYFSQRKMRDWPGLVAPSVVAARKTIDHTGYPWGDYVWGKAAEIIKPDWIVARPIEADQIRFSPELKRDYKLVKVFDVTSEINAAGVYYGISITYNDAVFAIFQRTKPP